MIDTKKVAMLTETTFLKKKLSKWGHFQSLQNKPGNVTAHGIIVIKICIALKCFKESVSVKKNVIPHNLNRSFYK